MSDKILKTGLAAGEIPKELASPMNSPVDELNCKECSALLHGDWLTTKDGEFCNHKCCFEWKNRTRAESPDSVVVTTNESGQAVAVTRQDGEGQILSTIWESPPPPVAAEGELIAAAENFIKDPGAMDSGSPTVIIRNLLSALQSRSTPPPVAGGELMLELLQEVMRSHADPESGDYNECDKPSERCQWCEDAAKAIAALQHQDCVATKALGEIVEIYAGMESFNVSTAPERYLLRITRQMYEQAKQSLERKNGQ